MKETTTMPNTRRPSEGLEFLARMGFVALLFLIAISSARVAVVAGFGGQWLAAASFGVFAGIAASLVVALLWVQLRLERPRLGSARRRATKGERSVDSKKGLLRRVAGWVFSWRAAVVVSTMASGACLASFIADGGSALVAAGVTWLVIGYAFLAIHDLDQAIRRMPVAAPRDVVSHDET